MTYELFLKEASEAKRLFSKGGGAGESIPGVEARIAALEKALGGTDGGAKGAGGRGGGVFGEGGEVRCSGGGWWDGFLLYLILWG